MRTVHLRVNDAATGRPTPVRLRVAGPDRAYFPPLGRPPDFAIGRNEDVGGNLLLDGERFTYIDGTCEVPLPSGVPLVIEATKGPEYRLLRHSVTLGPGQMTLRLAIERWTDLRAGGWYAGDTRAHFLPPHAALLEGRAEDLAVVNLLVRDCLVPSQDGKNHPAVPHLAAFSGQKPALEADGCLVVVNTFNRHAVLGSLGLLNCHRTVFPLSFGEPDASDDGSLADWCDQCHRKGGLVVWAEASVSAARLVGEALADLLLGKVDALELATADLDRSGTALAGGVAALLFRAGVPVALVGGSGKDSNRQALGGVRTYARLRPGAAFSYGEWIEAVRARRTFATTGPLLTFTVDGQDIGATIDRPDGCGTVRVRASAVGLEPFEFLEVLASDRGSVARVAPQGSPCRAEIELDCPVPATCLLAARCLGGARAASGPPSFAQTSPVQVRVAGQPPPPSPARERLVGHLEALRDWVEQVGRFENPRHREALLAMVEQARQRLFLPNEPNREGSEGRQ